MIKEKISKSEARKLVLLSQKLPPAKQAGPAIDATLSAIEHLGYIQIDTISVIQRAHHHTLWSRNPRYKTSHIDQLIENRKVFEYWSHAAAYLPMCDYRFSLYRKKEFATGVQKHWFEKDTNLMNCVLKRLTDEGPLMAKDFEHTRKSQAWNSKPAKQALQNLFMEGEIMISSRIGFNKVYDLTKNVLPAHIDTRIPDQNEYAHYLITSYLKANGLGTLPEITYLLKNIKPIINANIKEMLSNNELIYIHVGNNNYFALHQHLELLNQPISKAQCKILSPFDNLLIQRKRTQTLFDFDYQIECYVPKEKRKYGYFVLPILWDAKMAARMDCKADRKTGTLHVYSIFLEPNLKKQESFAKALSKEFRLFMQFNECNSFQINKTYPTSFKAMLNKELSS